MSYTFITLKSDPLFAQFPFFHVQRIEDGELKLPLPPHRKKETDFLYLTHGSTERTKGLVNYQVFPGHFFFLPKDQISEQTNLAAGSQGYYGYFHQDIFQKLFHDFEPLSFFTFLQKHHNPLVYVPESRQNKVEWLLETLNQTGKEKHPERGRLWATYLYALLLEIAPLQETQPQLKLNKAHQITRSYLQLLENRIYEWKKVADYADYLEISTDHLNKCVKTTLGKTSQELLGDMVILETKVLLRQTDFPIQQIATYMAGGSPSDFARFFKLRTRMSPKDYRRFALEF